MPHQKCSVCQHDEREAIDLALKGGATIRAVAGQFGLSKTAVDRHRNHSKHEQTRTNIGQIARIDQEIRKLHLAETRARKRRDNTAALQIAKELRSWFTLRTKAEAIASAQAQPTDEQITHAEALATARAIIEAELTAGGGEVIEWLRSLLERVPVTPVQPESERDTGKLPDALE